MKFLYGDLVLGDTYYASSVELPNSSVYRVASLGVGASSFTHHESRNTRSCNYGWRRIISNVDLSDELRTNTDFVCGAVMWDRHKSVIDYVGVLQINRSGRDTFTPLKIVQSYMSPELLHPSEHFMYEHQGCHILKYGQVRLLIDIANMKVTEL